MLVLASNSPRRKEILHLAGVKFVVSPADIDESLLPDETAPEYVLRLAEAKARAVLTNLGSDLADKRWILAADTTVVIDGKILGKPADAEEAGDMLRHLRGRTHQVLSGLALLHSLDGRIWCDLCTTDVQIRQFSDQEMNAYIASGDPLDKAGAYAIQHTGFSPVQGWHGCFANVVGLPLCRLERLMQAAGCDVKLNPDLVCREWEEPGCRVYEQLTENESLD